MKRLYLIRHGKSSWADPNLTDGERPLKQRGVSDCQLIAAELLRFSDVLSVVKCSPARRAVQTVEVLSQHLSGSVQCSLDERLYTFDWRELLSWLRSQPDELQALTIVGHNPALTELNRFLTGSTIENIPTCTVLEIHLNSLLRWQDIGTDSGVLKRFVSPKMLKNQTN